MLLSNAIRAKHAASRKYCNIINKLESSYNAQIMITANICIRIALQDILTKRPKARCSSNGNISIECAYPNKACCRLSWCSNRDTSSFKALAARHLRAPQRESVFIDGSDKIRPTTSVLLGTKIF